MFNLGNNQSESLMDMVGLLEREVGKKSKIDFRPMQPGDVKESFADIEYSIQKLGFAPKTPISSGIPKSSATR